MSETGVSIEGCLTFDKKMLSVDFNFNDLTLCKDLVGGVFTTLGDVSISTSGFHRFHNMFVRSSSSTHVVDAYREVSLFCYFGSERYKACRLKSQIRKICPFHGRETESVHRIF